MAMVIATATADKVELLARKGICGRIRSTKVLITFLSVYLAFSRQAPGHSPMRPMQGGFRPVSVDLEWTPGAFPEIDRW
jgi:hypothetical protein